MTLEHMLPSLRQHRLPRLLSSASGLVERLISRGRRARTDRQHR
jgi:hypothetical protein